MDPDGIPGGRRLYVYPYRAATPGGERLWEERPIGKSSIDPIRNDQTRAKGAIFALGSFGGCISRSGRVITTGPPRTCRTCHVQHGGGGPAVITTKNRKFQKSRVTSATENQPRRARIFFLVQSTQTQPEATNRHRQTSLRAHPNTPKNRRLAAGAQSTPL